MFTAVPSLSESLRIRGLSNSIIIENLVSITQQISDQLDIDLSCETEVFHSFDTTQKISPLLYNNYFLIKKAAKEGDVPKLLDALVNISTNSLYGDKLKIGTISQNRNCSQTMNSIRQKVISEFGEKHGYETINPVFQSQLDEHRTEVTGALSLLDESEPQHLSSIKAMVNEVKLFDGSVRGFTEMEMLGDIFIRISHPTNNPKLYYLEHLVHEAAHVQLFSLQNYDPLILNDSNELFVAPIRVQQRPMQGIFHACFVLARMLRAFRLLEPYTIGDMEYERRTFLSRIEGWYETAFTTVEKNAKFTDTGRAFFLTLNECAYE